MKMYNIKMEGPFFSTTVSGLPEWTPADESRDIYDSVTNKKYYGTNTKWVEYVYGATFSGITIVLDEAPTVDHTIQGFIFSSTVGESVNFGDGLYLKDSDSKYYVADATDDTEMPAVAMATETTTSGNACGLCAYGVVRDDTFDWQDIGQPIFVSLTGTTGNTLTQTAPSASGEQVQIVGWAMTVDTMFFNPNLAMVEIA